MARRLKRELRENAARELRIAEKRDRFVRVAVENGWTREDAERFADGARVLIEGRVEGFSEAFADCMELTEKYGRLPGG